MIVQRRPFMITWVLIVSGFCWACPLLAQTSTQVELKQALHFGDPDGNDVEVNPGTYSVSHTEGNQLQLYSVNKEPLRVQAQPGDHTESITQPKAMLLPDGEDVTLVSVMLLLPGGTGWEAIGSTTGVQSRGKLNLSRRPLNRSKKRINLSHKLQARIPRRPPPPAPPTLPSAIPIPSDCPAVVPYEIFGYPPGVTDPKAAIDGEKIIGEFVAEILKSYRPGCWPIKTVLITGHSDKSPGGIQVDDYISVQRAVDAKEYLQQVFKTRAAGMSIAPGYPNPADMNFIVGGIGARELDPNGPPQTAENRRVNFLSYHIPATIEEKTNRAGGDFQQQMLPTYLACRSRCSQTLNCRAFTYKKPVPPQTEGQCFFKKSGNRPTRDANAISGLVLPAP